MSEVTYFSGHGVKVTNTRVVINDTVYAISNITTIRISVRPINQLGVLVAGLGLFPLLYGLITVPMEIIAMNSDPLRGSPTPFQILGLGIIMVAGGVAFWGRVKPLHVIRFMTSTGVIQALRTADEALVSEIVKAVNNAIAQRYATVEK